jgi:hypothetical protein
MNIDVGWHEIVIELERIQDDLAEQIDFWFKRIVADIKLKAPDNQAKDFVMNVSSGKMQNLIIKLTCKN